MQQLFKRMIGTVGRWEKRAEAYEKTRWHKRQQPSSGANAAFRAVQADEEVVAEIERERLGKRRRGRGSSVPTVSPTGEGQELEKALQATFRAGKTRFEAAAATTASWPSEGSSEVAVVGRSNVGKSSLLNAVLGSGVCRTADQPGVTRTINWYSVRGGRLRVVDLPGYGFSFAEETVRQQWRQHMDQFLKTRVPLKKVFVAVDARVGLKSSDREMCESLDKAKRPFEVVLTKTDLVPPDDLARRATLVRQALATYVFAAKRPRLTSSVRNQGIVALRRQFYHYLAPEPIQIAGLK